MARGAIGRLAVAFAPWGRQWVRPFSSVSDSTPALITSAAGSKRKRVVFLGTPQVAALVLHELFQAAAQPSSNFEVAAVVSRPSSRQSLERRGEQQAAAAAAGLLAGSVAKDPASLLLRQAGALAQQPQQQPNWAHQGACAVERLAWSSGLPVDRILCPVSPGEPGFLDTFRRLQPDLAVTAAYGGMLPQAFLNIPKYGTINIHPSLLPKYRGAAPVTRALQDGCSISGVSLVFTVLQCDAGPVLEQQQVRIDPDIQAPELTKQLFHLGAQMLVHQLPGLLSGRVTARDAVPQDEAAASYATKVSKQEGILDFRCSAWQCHNHVRAMAGWPGSRAALLTENKATGKLEPVEVRVLRTRVVPAAAPTTASGPATACTTTTTVTTTTPGMPGADRAVFLPSAEPSGELPSGTRARVLYTSTGELLVPCGDDGNMLSILEVARRRAGNAGSSLPGPQRSFLTAQEFMNGLGKRRLFVPA